MSLAFDKSFLAILACPVCKAGLEYQPEKQRLVCKPEGLAYPISDEGIPVLLADKAVALQDDDL